MVSNRTSTLTLARPNADVRQGSTPILAASVLWGSTGTVSSLAPAGTPAAAVGSAGLVFGGLLLYIAGRGNRLRFTMSERWLLLLGAVAVAGYPVTFYPAVARTGVAVATVVALGSAPVFAGLLAWLTGRGRPTARWCLATLLAVIGCAVLVVGPELGASAGAIDLVGVGLAACGGLAYAVYALIGGTLIRRGHTSNAVMGAMFGGAAILVLPVVPACGPAWLTTPRGLAVALHLAVFTTFVAYRLYGYGLRRTTIETATALTLAEPAIAALLGVAVVGERLPLLSWSGMAVLALGLVLLTVRTGNRDVK
ncbi:EamA family transporter [Nocardia seriolae]|nr:EamA family transporter [Nocardia seriolae]MTJ72287.1 EamA family transporter [Nocardia seriolae]MTJ88386.1 EamA family transporter [Nocardia seriolae]MTK32371.1 EamA family transporter [Nocardia seriolae]MTK41712.1 EamA family transporter [Nocardia seriolae]